jgi:NTP pyrophosphatase (non-canonical NTP hydrolase)
MYRVTNLLALQMEAHRQIEKFGKQDHLPDRWMTILTEEVGEVAKEICNQHDSPCQLVYDNYEKELIQVAAVAMSMLENFQEQRKGNLDHDQKPNYAE